MSYLGNPPVVQATRTLSEFVATAGQTTFTPPGGYQVGYVDVVVNGSMLQQSDFTATDGSTVVLASACSLLDDVRVIALGTFQVANATPADGSVTTAKVVNGAITPAKMSGSGVPSFDGIKFPASQVASADANTLDDYEEGTFLPGLNFGGFNHDGTYSYQAGTYVKVGQLVFVTGIVGIATAGTRTGAAILNNLPFAGATGNRGGTMSGLYNQMSGVNYQINNDGPYTAQNFTTLYYNSTSGFVSLTKANFSAGGSNYVQFSFCYQANA